MPEHRKKVKKNLQYIPFRPYRHHSGRTMSSRMASPSTAVGGKVDLSRQDAQSSPEHTCRDSSGLPKIVQIPQWRSHFFWQKPYTVTNNSGTNDSLRSFFLAKTTSIWVSALWIELWITLKRLTFDSKYVNIMLMI